MASAAGYRELQDWAEALAATGELVFVIEGAGSWGAGLCEHLQHVGHRVLEVERRRRRDRRAGKSDRIDAIAAAKRVLTNDNVSTPRGRGILTAIRALVIARRSVVAERTRVLNQLQALTSTAPIALRDRNLTGCCSAHRRVPSWGDNQPGGTSWIYQMVSVRFIGFGPGRVDGLLERLQIGDECLQLSLRDDPAPVRHAHDRRLPDHAA